MATAGDTLTIHRGDTYIVTFTIGPDDLAGRLFLTFTAKPRDDIVDSSSTLQVQEYNGSGTVRGTGTGDETLLDGLLAVEGAAPEPADVYNATLVVTDAVLGVVTLTVSAVETAKLNPAVFHVYDIQKISTTGVVTTLVTGKLKITKDITRATS